MPLKTIEERIQELATYQLKKIVEIDYKYYSEEFVIKAKEELEKRLTNPNYPPEPPPENIRSFLGTGTMLYGKREVESDGSYIATVWRTLFFFPITHIKSYRVRVISMGLGSYQLEMKDVPLNRKQIINTYLLVWSVVGFSLIISLFGHK